VMATGDDFAPRRDGWYEHRGVWGEVTVGTVIGTQDSRTSAFEVIATAHPQQVRYAHTLWFQVRDLVTGELHSIAPRMVNAPVKILTRDPADTKTAPPTAPSDQQAIQLVIEQLGATHLATIDNLTGEITCPDYIYDSHLPDRTQPDSPDGRNSLGLLEHLRVAHGGPAVPDNWTIADLYTIHSNAHNPRFPDIGKGGFPHRHVPEDHSFI